MEKITDWISLWRELVEARAQARREKQENAPDRWQGRARRVHAGLKRRWAKPGPMRDFVVSHIATAPDATVLDIGAGTGAWAALLARHARQVTALEPSPAMIEVMEEHLAAQGIANVEIVQGTWPDVSVSPHDFTLCSHAMYGYPDLQTFVRRMVQVTRHTCFLVLRVPDAGGIMAEAAKRIWGQPHDSPNFHIAYNALLQMGIYPNVLMGDIELWDPWTNVTLERALDKVKRRFGLHQSGEYDEFLTNLLRQRLIHTDGQYVWPDRTRSALVYW